MLLGRLTKIILGQMCCIPSTDTDLGRAQSRFYAIMDKFSLSQTYGSCRELTALENICEVAQDARHLFIFLPLNEWHDNMCQKHVI